MPSKTRDPERRGDARLVWGVLIGASVLAAGLRLPFLTHQSLWFDEIFTRAVVARHTLGGIWDQIRATESTPPLYYLLAKLSSDIAGNSGAAAIRAPAALALVASVPASYFAFRHLVGERAALASAVFVAVNPLLVEYSFDARSYGLLVLTAALSVWGFASALRSGRPRGYTAWAAAGAACVWTHYFGGFLVGGEAFLLLALRRDHWRLGLSAIVGAGACCVPLLPLLVHQNHAEEAAFIARTSLLYRIGETIRQYGMGANVPRSWLELSGLVVLVATLAAGLWWERVHRGYRIIGGLMLFGVGLPLLIAMVGFEDRFYVRNVIAGVALLGALLAPAFLRLRLAPLVIYSCLAVLTAVWVTTDWRYQEPDWRAAATRARSLGHGSPVVVFGNQGGLVAAAYLRRPITADPVLARQILIIVVPYRAPGERSLGPGPISSSWPGLFHFTAATSSIVRGFRLILMRAPRPESVYPRALSGGTLLAAAGPASSH
jgi:mannosyltransferase